MEHVCEYRDSLESSAWYSGHCISVESLSGHRNGGLPHLPFGMGGENTISAL